MEEEVERDTIYGLSREDRPYSFRLGHRELTRRKLVSPNKDGNFLRHLIAAGRFLLS